MYFSQEGEDVILRRIFEDQKNGFYIDIGAHHPKRFSNTYYFYDRGWEGINIDATPGSMKIFQKFRPRDINLEIAISEKEQQLTYFMFNEPALNSFSKSLSDKR
ncbi:MAG TPA: SAM-dependent methyltransferase, partial [Candidatus Lambdaproteobacteria bacterium]|nr:SAM-dependent methyltransferase [Candidatus Lambdaproteobacteria bacterium]